MINVNSYGIFKNEKNNQEFFEDGYTIIDLLDDKSLMELISVYNKYLDLLSFSNGIHNTFEIDDVDLKKRIHNDLEKILLPRKQKFLTNFKSIYNCFILKKPLSAGNAFSPHQDWNFVDENLGHFSSIMWVSLSKTNEKNGGIEVLPGSHRWVNNYRVSPSSTPNGFSKVGTLVKDKMQPISLMPGQAILWDNRLIHSSKSNSTECMRIVLGSSVTHKDFDLVHYHKSPKDDSLIKFKCEKGFFINNCPSTLENAYEQGLKPNKVIQDGKVKPLTLEKQEQEFVNSFNKHFPTNSLSSKIRIFFNIFKN